MATGVTRIDADPPEGSLIYEDDIDAELLISGTPNHHGLTMMQSDDGRVACGVWGCGVYKERIPSFPRDELFVVLEGKLVITVDGSEAEMFSGRRVRHPSGNPVCLRLPGAVQEVLDDVRGVTAELSWFAREPSRRA